MLISEKHRFGDFYAKKKTHNSSRKIIKKVGQLYVTLICSLNSRKNRMTLVKKNIKNICHIHHAYARFHVHFSILFRAKSEGVMR